MDNLQRVTISGLRPKWSEDEMGEDEVSKDVMREDEVVRVRNGQKTKWKRPK